MACLLTNTVNRPHPATAIRRQTVRVRACSYADMVTLREIVDGAPLQKKESITIEDAKARFQTAPTTRVAEAPKYPFSHVLVTFRSSLNPNEVFTKVFPSSTPIKCVRRKIARLLMVSFNDLILAKNRTILRDAVPLSELKTDVLSNINIDIYTRGGVEFTLPPSNVPSDLEDILESDVPLKKDVKFVVIKFRLHNQEVFTRSFHSSSTVYEVKKNLALQFQCDADGLLLVKNKAQLKDRSTLLSLDLDEYGNIDVELHTKDNIALKLEKVNKPLPVVDVLTVAVPANDGTESIKEVTVEIISQPIKKPYLGGYKNMYTGTEYHHAYSQTPPKPNKIPSENKNCRDTQTVEEVEKNKDTPYSRATQICNENVFIPNVTDRIVAARPYETYEEMVKRLDYDHHANVIQRTFRHHRFRQMVDRWKTSEIARISKLHSKGPKIAEFNLLLDKEVELLRCIESYRVKVKEDTQNAKDKRFLDELCKPIVWYARDGRPVGLDTIEIQKARQLRNWYLSFIRNDMSPEERLKLLVDAKTLLQEYVHPLTEEITALLDQECELIVRKYTDKQLEFLRKRIAKSIMQFIKSWELNSKVTEVPDVREFRKMEHGKLYFCQLCHKLKMYTDFPFKTKMTGLTACKSCTWKDPTERCWVDMTPYKFILRAIQRDERRRKCWGSLAFVLQEKDIYFIVEKLWHSHSAISECRDMMELRLCRWNVNEDWSPWNCFLVTVTEMKAHLKLEDPESVYDEELVKKVHNKLMLGRANFQQLFDINKQFTGSGDWQTIKASAIDHVGGLGVDPI
ncbi:IQ and ubiquitin-like domain-containing protein [Eumeta japonica]|uniref:IQ and ubiquitin-like domain-containing protein n=1 Tax=Eumeta variegata TaxID=151549 RepID=A0A4C1STV3_EUMVA|nr:IQ and ubiquitin-like domain-containing protein [Eumeta japonica]